MKNRKECLDCESIWIGGHQECPDCGSRNIAYRSLSVSPFKQLSKYALAAERALRNNDLIAVEKQIRAIILLLRQQT
jgi:hypothetical protein